MSRTGRVSRTCACQAAQPGGQRSGEAEPRVELVELQAGHGMNVAVATTVSSADGPVSGPRYWSMMARTRMGNRQSAPAASGWPALGTVTAYAAAIVAFAYALISLYWALGGHALISTIGGYVEQFARRGGALPVLAALAATLAKVAGGLLALALVRPCGRVVPRRWLLAGSAGASALLVVYRGLNVLLGALVLSGVTHPAGSVDRTALRWHVGSGTCGSWSGGSCWRWLPSATGGGR
jgi:hypothetical protein